MRKCLFFLSVAGTGFSEMESNLRGDQVFRQIVDSSQISRRNSTNVQFVEMAAAEMKYKTKRRDLYHIQKVERGQET